MTNLISNQPLPTKSDTEPTKRFDIRQQITDVIIKQLEAGTIPWRQSWIDKTKPLYLPVNAVTGNRYNGINILLLWCSANKKKFTSNEWASFKQWNSKKETIRQGEKGSLIVYADTYEKEVDGELQRFQFLKASKVFNRCQLNSYFGNTNQPEHEKIAVVNRIETFDNFIKNTSAEINHHDGAPFFSPAVNKIFMPQPSSFLDTEKCTAAENYYATLSHELIHWAWSYTGRDKSYEEKYGAKKAYAIEELIAEFGAAFLTSQFDIMNPERQDHASYIASWLKALKNDKSFLITAASEANRALNAMEDMQPLKF